MAEEEVRAARQEKRERHLLDSEDDVGGAQVVCQIGPRIDVRSVRENTQVGRLHEDLYAELRNERPHVIWSQRNATLPFVLVFASNSCGATPHG